MYYLLGGQRGLSLRVFAHQLIELFGRYFLLRDGDRFLSDSSELGVSDAVDEVLLRALVLEHALSVVLEQFVGHRSHAVHSELVLSYDEGELIEVLIRDLHTSSFEELTLDAVEGDVIDDLWHVTIEIFDLSLSVASEEDALEQSFVVSYLASLLQKESTQVTRELEVALGGELLSEALLDVLTQSFFAADVATFAEGFGEEGIVELSSFAA